MNEKPNEWIAVADLMSGVLAVVALMLVVAILSIKQQSAIAEAPPLSEAPVHSQHVESTQGKLLADLHEFLREFDRSNTDPAIKVSAGDLRILLADGAFDNSSACLRTSAIQSLAKWRAVFHQRLIEIQDPFNVTLEISGHTDSNPVRGGQVSSISRCASYHDNVSLSVARATTAREELIKGLSPKMASHFIVTGYGDTRPLPGIETTNPRNRRVEVRFIIPSNLDASSPTAAQAINAESAIIADRSLVR